MRRMRVNMKRNELSTIRICYIEECSFFHFLPGSKTLKIGTVGCNFDCKYCINHYVAREGNVFTYDLIANEVVKKAIITECRSIVFAENEPTVSIDYFLEIAKKAKKFAIPVGCLTNGYFSEKVAQKIAKYTDLINISIKGFSDDFYRKICGVDSVEPVLKNIERLYGKVHLEITTPVIPKMNDHDIPKMAQYISSLNKSIPWHLLRFYPAYKMKEYKSPTIDDMSRIYEQARDYLQYVYLGYFPGSKWLDTLCPNCGKTLIKRVNTGQCYNKIISNELTNNNSCPVCDTKIPIAGCSSPDLVKG